MLKLVKNPLAVTLISAMTAVSVHGWGALYNRVTPAKVPSSQMLGNYYNYYTESRHNVEEPNVMASNLDIVDSNDELDSCYQAKCTKNEQCCEGYVCVDMEGSGSCMPLYGGQAGDSCNEDNDCAIGLMCAGGYSGSKKCEEPPSGLGKYGDTCETSSDCNGHAGLCCRLQRRQRMKPIKVCSYFTYSDICIGTAPASKVRRTYQYTANEKRQSAHPDNEFLRYRKFFF